MFTSSTVRRARSGGTGWRFARRWPVVSVLGIPFFGSGSGNPSTPMKYEEGSPVMKSTPKKRGLLLVGGVFGAGIATVVVSAFTLFAATGVAASKDKPHVVNPPSVNGTPQEGRTLTGDRGDWSNSPTNYDYRWLRCGPNGGNCAVIVGQVARTYTLRSVDVGNTIRFRAIAKNADGSNQATSV